MKSFISKYSQQIILALLVIAVTAGVGFAGYSIPDISSGFLRNKSDGKGLFQYGYGFGYVNNIFQTGYGYGYDLLDRGNNYGTGPDYSDYGFFDGDGSPRVTVDPQKTTATLTYITHYLSKISYAYSTDKNIKDNTLGYYQESSFNSGMRSQVITGLTCNTLYYYDVASEDAGGNKWIESSYFTTLPCSDDGKPTGNSTNSAGSYANIKPFGAKPESDALTAQFPESPKLYYGDFGPGPKKIQLLLNKLGFKLDTKGAGSPGHETSFFGPKTKAALKKFQAAHGLTPDGIYGPLVQAAMLAELNK